MIVDIRTYTLIPGQLGAFNKLYESEGYAIQTRHLGQPLGYHFIDIGPQNRIVHLWGYPDIATRAARRAEMEKDADWISYRTKSGALFQRQENKIMKHAPFYPAKMGTPKPYGIIDYRTYTAHPGKLATFLQAYESEALAVQMKHLGNCLGWFMSDIGTQNEVVHMWGYADLNDRAARRNAMQADPAWAPYLSKGTSFLVNMENAILRPCPFFKPAA